MKKSLFIIVSATLFFCGCVNQYVLPDNTPDETLDFPWYYHVEFELSGSYWDADAREQRIYNKERVEYYESDPPVVSHPVCLEQGLQFKERTNLHILISSARETKYIQVLSLLFLLLRREVL